jgi:hypothetical protein
MIDACVNCDYSPPRPARQSPLPRMRPRLRQNKAKCIEQPTPQRIPWTDLSRATVTPGFIGATLFLKHKKSVRDILGVFKTREDAARFVDQVNDRIARANANDQSQPRANPQP